MKRSSNLLRLRPQRIRRGAGWAVFLLTLIVPLVSWGQTYQESRQLPMPEEFKERRLVSAKRQEKNEALRRGGASESDKKALENFYLGFMFRALTREDYADLAAALRMELLRDISNAADPETRKALVGIAYRGSTGLLKEPRFHPSAHVNAVLLLGELNQQEGAGTTSAPVPYAAITKQLAELVQSEQHSEPVRVTALQELERHVRLRNAAKGSGALTKEERDLISKIALAVVSQAEVPPHRTPEAHEWVRIKAVRILAALGDPGPDGAAIKALEAVVSDPKSGVDLRATAVEALGGMDTTSWNTEPAKFVVPVARLLVDVLEAELDDMRGPNRIRGGRTEVFETETDDTTLADPSTKDCRRRLLPRLAQLDRGLNGDSRTGRTGIVAALGAGPFEPIVAGLKQSLNAANDLTSTMDEFGYELDQVREVLDDQFPDPTRPPRMRRGRDG